MPSSSTFDPELLTILRCPVTGQPLRWATEEEKERFTFPKDREALITEDGSRIYPLEGGIPLLAPGKDGA